MNDQPSPLNMKRPSLFNLSFAWIIRGLLTTTLGNYERVHSPAPIPSSSEANLISTPHFSLTLDHTTPHDGILPGQPTTNEKTKPKTSTIPRFQISYPSITSINPSDPPPFSSSPNTVLSTHPHTHNIPHLKHHTIASPNHTYQ